MVVDMQLDFFGGNGQLGVDVFVYESELLNKLSP